MWMTLVDDIDCLNSCPEPVKEAPGKRKKEMAKQKAAPEAKKQKVEGNLENWGTQNSATSPKGLQGKLRNQTYCLLGGKGDRLW